MSTNDQQLRVKYYGSPSHAHLFVRYLEKEGCRVAMPEVQERRDLASAIEAVAVAITVWGTKEAVQAAIRKLRERYAGGKIDIEDDDRPGYL